jgi:hypothetical protein
MFVYESNSGSRTSFPEKNKEKPPKLSFEGLAGRYFECISFLDSYSAIPLLIRLPFRFGNRNRFKV